MDGESTRERYLSVCRRIEEAKARAGRENSPVHLVAVTKYAAMEQVRELIELGHVDFGEGRAQHFLKMAPQVQEFLDRRKTLGESDGPDSVRWHFIGHLQRNKAKKELCHSNLHLNALLMAAVCSNCEPASLRSNTWLCIPPRA